ncbi:segregation and condensation protein A [Pumilibacter intestinalis]|uniref:segregation and condensation protein A n=1 Tax=Pumilibacter intestinalis TaxID=2941511 RepID=UPI00203F8A58|nr:segregation/condensation protein A [Pumilibacter intestinalis]
MAENTDNNIIQTAELPEGEEINEASYKVKLESFEGPLDLLLHLIKAAKIEIKDIFVSQITEQYIEYINDIKEVDLENASEFIEMAAWLIEIKSKSLLPKPQEEVPEEEDSEKQLIQRLEEYKLYKEACQKMKEQETVGIHFRSPDASVGEPRFVLKDMTMEGLMKALRKMFLKMEKRSITQKERHITLDRFTVAEKMSHIKDFMLLRDTATFDELFEDDYSKSEIITTFQALLELLKLQFVKAEQQEIFGEILLKKVA